MGSKTPKWFSQRKRREPESPLEPPIGFGPLAGGAFLRSASERDRKIRDEILRRADDFSRRIAMDRREFLASALGMATTFSVFNLAAGCGDRSGFHGTNSTIDFARASEQPDASANADDSSRPDGGACNAPGSRDPSAGMAGDGGYQICKDMCLDGELAQRALHGDYFILDVATSYMGRYDHHAQLASPPQCGQWSELNESKYIKEFFLEGETTMTVLTAGSVGPIGEDGDIKNTPKNADLIASRDYINQACAPGADRVLATCLTNPFDGPERNGALMEQFKALHGTRGWKCMPPIGSADGTGWFLTDPKGIAFIEKAIALRDPLISVHKGYPLGPTWSRTHADPMPDVGVVATMFPSVSFLICNSAGDGSHHEGPYDDNPDPRLGGVDRLVKVVQDNDLRMKNVYAEMGLIWYLINRFPIEATHYLGKMLKHLGEERLLWGTNAFMHPALQCQIAALKTFKMDTGLREMHEYPDLTDSIKRSIFGLAAAKVYRVDPNACRYALDEATLGQAANANAGSASDS